MEFAFHDVIKRVTKSNTKVWKKKLNVYLVEVKYGLVNRPRHVEFQNFERVCLVGADLYRIDMNIIQV